MPVASVTLGLGLPRPVGAAMSTDDLHARRVSAVRAWTQFVAEGAEEAAVRPEILRSWQLSGVVSPTVTHAPLDDEGDTAEFWNQSPAADRRDPGPGRAAAHRRGRRPGHRDHRRADPDPLDLRRHGDAPQGRDGELRARRALGRAERRDQRAGHRRSHRSPVDGLQRRALRRGRPQLGVLGRAGLRPGDRSAAGGHRPVDHLGPHPPDRARDRARDGAAHRGRAARRPSYDPGGDRPAPTRPASR